LSASALSGNEKLAQRRPAMAQSLAQAIDKVLGPGSAQAVDGSSVQVSSPADPSQRTSFMAIVENIELSPGEASAKVIVNSRTGTVVIGQNVHVSAAAVTHGSLTVTISNDPIVSQPGPLSGGQTAVVPNSQIDVREEKNKMFLFDPGVSLNDIVEAVNQVGAAPGDLVAILEALKEAGALRAELIVI
jgi:flagellar P-ring protein precursor FlgI